MTALEKKFFKVGTTFDFDSSMNSSDFGAQQKGQDHHDPMTVETVLQLQLAHGVKQP